jgi:hypothetical protein
MFCERTRKEQPRQLLGNSKKNKEWGSHHEDSTTGTNVHWDKNEQKWSTALSVSNKILLFCYRSRSET